VIEQRAYYDIVRDWLDQHIDAAVLPPGMRLTVSAVADRLSVSRSPVKRALDLLEQQGRLTRDGRQGYIVAGADKGEVETANLHLLALDTPGDDGSSLVRPSWQRVLQGVTEAVMNCIPFGIYQISEVVIGDHFGVSRTVTREVLARLHDRDVISKDRASHWIAGPLSARMLDDAHDLRRLLEPAALAAAGEALDTTDIDAMLARVDAALAQRAPLSTEALDGLEADLHDRCLQGLRNRRLLQTLGQLQAGRVVNRLFATYIGQHDDTAMLREHRLVLEHLRLGDPAGAAGALRYHLDLDHRRTRDRLKVLSVFSEPEIAPYLTRMI
jgi:DNA-binding GntR family transcriptional regulator